MSSPGLQAQKLTYRFHHEAGVSGIDLQVRAGDIHAIVGLNGAGKTTLMRLLLGMLRPHSGRALVRGVPVAAAGPGVWACLGHLVDTPLAYPELTAAANLIAAGRLRGLNRKQAEAAAERIAADLGLRAFAARRTRVLSTGNRQRLGVAAALVHDPDTVVLDEPTSSLDPAGVIAVRSALRRRADDGAAVLVSSHHLDEVARVADDISVINRGRLIGILDPGAADLEREFFALVYADETLHGATGEPA